MPYFFGIKNPLFNTILSNKILGLSNIFPIEITDREVLHITILYVGHYKISNEAIMRIENDIQNIGLIRIRITNNVELYPNISKPRAIVLKVEDLTGKLLKIRNIILNRLKEYKVPVEDKYINSFSPHITIGRIRAKLDFETIENVLTYFEDMFRSYTEIVCTNYIELIDSTEGLYKTIKKIYTTPRR